MQDEAPTGEAGGIPIYIALVDTTCGEDFLELVKSALLAALEALPAAALFGFITFSTKVGRATRGADKGRRLAAKPHGRQSLKQAWLCALLPRETVSLGRQI
jgi:hypothetical protein